MKRQVSSKEVRRRAKISKSLKEYIRTHPEARKSRSWKGRKHSAASKHKMSLAGFLREQERRKTGYRVSDEAREKIRKAGIGRKLSKESRHKISVANKGKRLSPEQRTRMIAFLKEYYRTHPNHFKGKQHTEETIRKLREANLGRFRGEKGPNWQGGISSLPYGVDWTVWLRLEIKNRDGNGCKICQSTTKLDVHHIDFDKQNNRPENLITLCKRDHGKANRGVISKEQLRTLINKKRQGS